MRILRPATENEVIAVFLRAELGSERYGEVLQNFLHRDGVDPDVLARPNLSDSVGNRYRRALLDEHRGFERRIGLFDGFPARVAWYRAALSGDEVLAIRYIDWDWWLTISNGSRSALVAAERIRRGEIDGVTVEEHAVIAESLRSPTPPELIAATTPDRSSIVLVEGHVRLTTYALFPELLPKELELYLGEAEDMGAWSEF